MRIFYICLSFLLPFISFSSLSQTPVEVTEGTLKVSGFGEEVFYYGFAEGDKIIFNFQEVNNKELKELEIIEYPNNSKYLDYKTRKIENKSIAVTKQGVYKFCFRNSALGGRVCKFKIQRIPASDLTQNFNSSVAWVAKQDTTWNTYTKEVIAGYDTVRTQKMKKMLTKIDTTYNLLFDKTLRVHSFTSTESQYTYATVQLPNNTVAPNMLNPYKTTEVIAWSYWLGVGQKAREEYEKANNRIASGVKVLGALTGYGALATLISTGISMFGVPAVGDNVRYRIYGYQNGREIEIDYGNVVAASARNSQILQGGFNISLYNNNIGDGIDVTLKMLVQQVTKVWKDLPYTELAVTPKYEKRFFKDPIVKSYTAPVTGR